MSDGMRKIITGTCYSLAFLTPLLLTKYNYELFEFNKMLFVYAATVVIAGSWIIKSVHDGAFTVRKTPFDIPLLLFFLSQVVSTIFSIDPHMSIWGYYGRFNGGLLSILCYIVLFKAAATHLSGKNIRVFLMASLVSGFFVAVYGVAQHFGIDDHLWVQDVKNRVFSTLGQPNWLAAYMAICLPVLFAFGLSFLEKEHAKSSSMYRKTFLVTVCIVLCYITLLYTKSRSGFAAFWAVNVGFWGYVLFISRRTIHAFGPLPGISMVLIVNVVLLVFTVLIGTPFPRLNRFTPVNDKQEISDQQTGTPEHGQATPPAILITDSGDIRKIVWKGSIEAIKSNPIIGYGPETFAWAYYRFRPEEHNTTSEWDFLYNKAHNEYLNYGVTTGLLGLGTYILVIGIFIAWFTKQHILPIFVPHIITHDKHQQSLGQLDQLGQLEITLLSFALFSSWVSILITNFFGFSVVVINMYFFLIPAFSYILGSPQKRMMSFSLPRQDIVKRGLMGVVVAGVMYLLYGTALYWLSDYQYNRGVVSKSAGSYEAAFEHLQNAITLRPVEPTYKAEFAETLAIFSVSSFEQNDASASAVFAQTAIASSDEALSISPYSVSLWKSRTRLFYTLSQVDESYLTNALTSIQTAANLAPTDAKIWYNVGLLENATGNTDTAIKTMEKTIDLKPNYRDAAWALALFYEEKKDIQSRDKWLNYILENINLNDQEVLNTLQE